MFFLQDKRYHIVEELCKNEQEYVEALTVLKDVSTIYLLSLHYVTSKIELLTHFSSQELNELLLNLIRELIYSELAC